MGCLPIASDTEGSDPVAPGVAATQLANVGHLQREGGQSMSGRAHVGRHGSIENSGRLSSSCIGPNRNGPARNGVALLAYGLQQRLKVGWVFTVVAAESIERGVLEVELQVVGDQRRAKSLVKPVLLPGR